MRSKKDLDDIMIDSLVLSNLLVEKFEIMQENNLIAHKAKQSVKTSITHLSEYIKKVFKYDDNEKEKDFIIGSNIILIKQEKVEKILADKNILIIDDRKSILRNILIDLNLNKDLIQQILYDVENSEILKI